MAGTAARLGSKAADNPVLRMAAGIALMRREKWDGSGYLQEMAGEQIPVEARIVALADVYDALASHRPYKPPYPEHEALRIMEAMARSHFDPAVYAAFRKHPRYDPSAHGSPTEPMRHRHPRRHDEADLVCG